MNVPLEISFHGLSSQEDVKEVIRQRAEKLERYCDHLSSCRVAVETRREREHPFYRVRVDLTVPPSHELAAESHGEPDPRDLNACIRSAFEAAERQLKELTAKQRRDVKEHPAQQVVGVVTRVFPKEKYGFILSAEGGEIYFHANSVINEDFAGVKAGMGVQYEVGTGAEGPQASTVRIVDRRASGAAEQPAAPSS